MVTLKCYISHNFWSKKKSKHDKKYTFLTIKLPAINLYTVRIKIKELLDVLDFVFTNEREACNSRQQVFINVLG